MSTGPAIKTTAMASRVEQDSQVWTALAEGHGQSSSVRSVERRIDITSPISREKVTLRNKSKTTTRWFIEDWLHGSLDLCGLPNPLCFFRNHLLWIAILLLLAASAHRATLSQCWADFLGIKQFEKTAWGVSVSCRCKMEPTSSTCCLEGSESRPPKRLHLPHPQVQCADLSGLGERTNHGLIFSSRTSGCLTHCDRQLSGRLLKGSHPPNMPKFYSTCSNLAQQSRRPHLPVDSFVGMHGVDWKIDIGSVVHFPAQ